jgi:hypothetical protein
MLHTAKGQCFVNTAGFPGLCFSLCLDVAVVYDNVSIAKIGFNRFSIKTTRLSWDLVYLQLAVNVYMILLQRLRETLKVIVAAWVLSDSTTA